MISLEHFFPGHWLFVFMHSTSDLSDRSNLSDAGDLSNLSGPIDPSDPNGPSDPSALSDPSGPSDPPKKYPAGQTGGGGPPFPVMEMLEFFAMIFKWELP